MGAGQGGYAMPGGPQGDVLARQGQRSSAESMASCDVGSTLGVASEPAEMAGLRVAHADRAAETSRSLHTLAHLSGSVRTFGETLGNLMSTPLMAAGSAVSELVINIESLGKCEWPWTSPGSTRDCGHGTRVYQLVLDPVL